MNKIAFTFILIGLLASDKIFAQNLVPNPSFEDTVNVRLMPDINLNNSLNWYMLHGGTPDYWNEDYGTAANPPFFNLVGRSGKSFSGIYTSLGTSYPNRREYIQVRINQPLVAGKQYAVGYYYYYGNGYSITHNLGFRFSYDTLSYPSWFSSPPITYDEHLGTNSLSYMDTNLALVSAISVGGDTNAWYLLQTTYTAVGGEEYLTIGNLYGVDSTSYTHISTPLNPINQISSYYIIDDVYVLDIEQLLDTNLVYIDTFNMGVPVTYNCIENSCIDPANATGIYSTLADCQEVCAVNAIKENNSTKQLLKITDVLGRESKPTPNMLLFYLYSDGTVEKRVLIE